MSLDDLANKPKKTSGDEGSVEEREAKDAIALDVYQRAEATTKPPFGMHVARVVPRGTVPPT